LETSAVVAAGQSIQGEEVERFFPETGGPVQKARWFGYHQEGVAFLLLMLLLEE
jgi:hypothetical protein